MPNRIIRDGINRSSVIDRLDYEEEVFFRRLLNEHDDFGRFYGDSRLLRSALYAKRSDRVREADVTRWRDGCVAAGAIALYFIGSEPFVMVHKTSKPRAKRSKFPQPPLGVLCWRGSAESTELCSYVKDEDNLASTTPCAHMRARAVSNPSLFPSSKRGSGGKAAEDQQRLPFASGGNARTGRQGDRPLTGSERVRAMLENEL